MRDAIKASTKDADPEKFYLWHILIGSTPQGKESLAFDTPDGVIEAFMRKEFALPPEVL